MLNRRMLNRRSWLATARSEHSLSRRYRSLQHAFAQAPAGKVTVVTSFSKDVTDPIKKAFEKANPGLTLEVQNRNTNAGVKFVEETKANNQIDLFWASAPGCLRGAEAEEAAADLQAEGRRAFPKRSAPTRSTTRTASISALPPRATASCGTSAI